MVRTQVYLPASHHRAIQREARKTGVSMTELVRRLVAEHVTGKRGVAAFRKEAVLSFVALGSSGSSDGSERHDGWTARRGLSTAAPPTGMSARCSVRTSS